MASSKPPARSSPGSDRHYEEHELRLVDGREDLVPVAQGFIIPGKDFEVGERGFSSFKDRVGHMLRVFQASSGARVIGVRYERQDPKSPYARVQVRLPEYDLPRP